MKIKIVIFIIIILGIVLTPVLLYTIGNRYATSESIYEEHWNIVLPSDFKQIYHNQDKHDFQGKGRCYTIYETTEMNILPMMSSEKKAATELLSIIGNSKDSKKKDMEEFVQAIATDLRIPEIHKPQFDDFYLWQKLVKYGDNTLSILYFPNVHKIYFVEELR
ncbi:MAG: hypothetical protein K0S01_1449 [Herbinix sp.]|jgi:hypothetical protein|nr:hypothetical protein [Herbinix sp.]